MNFFNTLNLLNKATSLNNEKNCKKIDIELMISSLLNLEKVNLYFNPPLMNELQREELFSMILRRNKGEPLAYILGSKGFWKVDFEVNEHVLVPRPETEALIETILDQIVEDSLTVLDAGTGSGAIAISLAIERDQWHVVATDKSGKALQIAKRNKLKLKASVNFLRSNWLDPFGPERFDLIVSNPPYIDENDPCLKTDGVKFEPLSSLVSKNKGLGDLEEIILRSYNCLKRGGNIFLEHAPWQTNEVKKFLSKSNFIEIKVFKDLNGDERISSAFKF